MAQASIRHLQSMIRTTFSSLLTRVWICAATSGPAGGAPSHRIRLRSHSPGHTDGALHPVQATAEAYGALLLPSTSCMTLPLKSRCPAAQYGFYSIIIAGQAPLAVYSAPVFLLQAHSCRHAGSLRIRAVLLSDGSAAGVQIGSSYLAAHTKLCLHAST